MPEEQHPGEHKPPRIRVGRVESVDLFEIKDSELEMFEHGSPADLQLNFAIFLFSIAFTALVSLLTATFPNISIHVSFIVVTVVGILLGSYLLLAWRRNKGSSKRVCTVIRERIKEVDISITKTTAAVPPPVLQSAEEEDATPDTKEPKG